MSDRSRIHYRIDAALKEQVRQYAEARGISIGEAMEAFARKNVGSASTEADGSLQALQKQLARADKDLAKLRKTKSEREVRTLQLAETLISSYPNLAQDPEQIRIQAVQDYREGKASWLEERNIASEEEVVEATRIAIPIIQLEQTRSRLEAELAAILGISPIDQTREKAAGRKNLLKEKLAKQGIEEVNEHIEYLKQRLAALVDTPDKKRLFEVANSLQAAYSEYFMSESLKAQALADLRKGTLRANIMKISEDDITKACELAMDHNNLNETLEAKRQDVKEATEWFPQMQIGVGLVTRIDLTSGEGTTGNPGRKN